MKSRLFSSFVLSIAMLLVAASASATVHLMQIERVIGGIEGNTDAQAIQLRMRADLQGHTELARLVVRDATGANPLVLASPSTSVASEVTGRTILYATAAFSDATDPPAVPDFVMEPIPPSYLAAGSLTFENSLGDVYWRLSWGGTGYTGNARGTTFNDVDGRFAPNFAGPLPSSALGAVRFQGVATDLSTDNASDYALDGGATSFTNNAGQSFVAISSGTAAPIASIRELELLPPTPNPFNPRTTVTFELSHPGYVTLRVLTVGGALVDVIGQGLFPSGTGTITWNGTDSSGRAVSSGTYLVELRSNSDSQTRKVTLLK